MFDDRLQAARALVPALRERIDEPPVVLAIPRGGVPMGACIAEALGGALDVVLVRKLGAPGNPELAIGAVSEDGSVELAPGAQAYFGERYVDAETERQLATLRARRERYTPLRPPLDVAGRTVVVVDDGSATGATMAAALSAVRQRQPRRLLAAMAVAPPDAVTRLEHLADAVVCLDTPEPFLAVGCFFREFGQVSDAEVEQQLREAAARGSGGE